MNSKNFRLPLILSAATGIIETAAIFTFSYPKHKAWQAKTEAERLQILGEVKNMA